MVQATSTRTNASQPPTCMRANAVPFNLTKPIELGSNPIHFKYKGYIGVKLLEEKKCPTTSSAIPYKIDLSTKFGSGFLDP